MSNHNPAPQMNGVKNPPFIKRYQLDTSFDDLNTTYLPGYPQLKLSNESGICNFLEREFRSDITDRIAPYLWFMSTQSSSNISPLHRQKVKQRDIVISEDPKLHLVWIYDRIFIKPLPKYLLSHEFWTRYLLNNNSILVQKRKPILAAALGFLRTYFHLIRYESDFNIAQRPEFNLIPSTITWEEFCNFSANFADIDDIEVSERYHYGEIRLTRLNFYTKLLLRESHYQRLYSQYAEYFARFFAPLLFLFGFLSVLLSSMQLVMAIEQIFNKGWTSFWQVSRWFSVVILILLCVVVLVLAVILLVKFAREWKRAILDRYKFKWKKTKNEGKSLGSP